MLLVGFVSINGNWAVFEIMQHLHIAFGGKFTIKATFLLESLL